MRRDVKKITTILALTSALSMGIANAQNWSPWNNNNSNYNPFSNNGGSFTPWNNNNYGPFNNVRPYNFNSGSNSFGPFNTNNMQPFNNGYNWQDRSFNPMDIAQEASESMQETVESTTGENPAKVVAEAIIKTGDVIPTELTAELFMQMVQVTDVDEGVTGPEVDESIKSMATNESILHVASFPLSEQITNVTGKPYRHLTIHNICDAATAGKIADVDDRYAIILPCRIAVVEGKDGKIRMISMNSGVMSLMNLPKEAYDPAKEVADKMDAILEGAKEGSF